MPGEGQLLHNAWISKMPSPETRQNYLKHGKHGHGSLPMRLSKGNGESWKSGRSSNKISPPSTKPLEPPRLGQVPLKSRSRQIMNPVKSPPVLEYSTRWDAKQQSGMSYFVIEPRQVQLSCPDFPRCSLRFTDDRFVKFHLKEGIHVLNCPVSKCKWSINWLGSGKDPIRGLADHGKERHSRTRSDVDEFTSLLKAIARNEFEKETDTTDPSSLTCEVPSKNDLFSKGYTTGNDYVTECSPSPTHYQVTACNARCTTTSRNFHDLTTNSNCRKHKQALDSLPRQYTMPTLEEAHMGLLEETIRGLEDTVKPDNKEASSPKIEGIENDKNAKGVAVVDSLHQPLSSDSIRSGAELNNASSSFLPTTESTGTDSESFESDSEIDWENDSASDSVESSYSLFAAAAITFEEAFSIASSIDSSKQDLISQIMNEFWIIINEGSGNKRQCAQNGTGSKPMAPIQALHKGSKDKGQKRPRDDDRDDHQSDDERAGTPNFSGNTPPRANVKKFNFSCPFRKHDPQKYNVREWRLCALNPFDSVSRVKDHLYKCHKIYPCLRCKNVFSTEEELTEHSIAKQGCDPSENTFEGVTPDMCNKLRSRKKTHRDQTEEDRWCKVYILLFPGEEIPSPYHEPVLEESSSTGSPTTSRTNQRLETQDLLRFWQVVRVTLERIIDNEALLMPVSVRNQFKSVIRGSQHTILRNLRASIPPPSSSSRLQYTPTSQDALERSGFQSQPPEFVGRPPSFDLMSHGLGSWSNGVGEDPQRNVPQNSSSEVDSSSGQPLEIMQEIAMGRTGPQNLPLPDNEANRFDSTLRSTNSYNAGSHRGLNAESRQGQEIRPATEERPWIFGNSDTLQHHVATDVDMSNPEYPDDFLGVHESNDPVTSFSLDMHLELERRQQDALHSLSNDDLYEA